GGQTTSLMHLPGPQLIVQPSNGLQGPGQPAHGPIGTSASGCVTGVPLSAPASAGLPPIEPPPSITPGPPPPPSSSPPPPPPLAPPMPLESKEQLAASAADRTSWIRMVGRTIIAGSIVQPTCRRQQRRIAAAGRRAGTRQRDAVCRIGTAPDRRGAAQRREITAARGRRGCSARTEPARRRRRCRPRPAPCHHTAPSPCAVRAGG